MTNKVDNIKQELRDNEVVVKYKDREYIQVLLPVKAALIQRKKFMNIMTGDIDEIEMYEVVLKNFFNKEYSFSDFTSTDEVDTICWKAFINQYQDGELGE